jgi:hypothetical protein
MNGPNGNQTKPDDEDLACVVDELAERLRHGEKLDWPACLRQHARHAEALKQLAPALEILVNYGGATP